MDETNFNIKKRYLMGNWLKISNWKKKLIQTQYFHNLKFDDEFKPNCPMRSFKWGKSLKSDKI